MYIIDAKPRHWQVKKQESQQLQRDHTTCYVSKFVLCFTSYGSFQQQK